MCTPLGVRATFKPMKIMRQTLMKVKTRIPEEKKRKLKVRLGEHKQAVKRGDPKNGIAVHAHKSHHAIVWDGTTVKTSVTRYWQRRTTEAIHIRMSRGTMNLDSGLQLPTMWNLILNLP